ncbi:MAG: hypothetical protein ACODAJ_03685, partial [Planctomycetota bacterium]
IKKLFKLTPLLPRYWQRGDVVQVVRVETRRRLLTRSVILLVQDDPLPAKSGCLGMGAFMVLARLVRGERRIYVVSVDGGEEEADAIAGAVADVLGVTVDRAEFRFNNLTML